MVEVEVAVLGAILLLRLEIGHLGRGLWVRGHEGLGGLLFVRCRV